jgi:Family of unknown function (DUF6318)
VSDSRHGRRRGLTRLGLPVILLLAACSGGGSSSPQTAPDPSVGTSTTVPTSPSSTTTPAATVAPSPTPTPPVLPEAAKQRTQAGAEAFLKYFFEVYNYSYATLDVGLLQSICLSTSKFCDSVTSNVTNYLSNNQRVVGGKIDVTLVHAGPISKVQVSLVDSLINQAPAQTVAADGSRSQFTKSIKGALVKAALKWVDSAWIATGVEVQS